MKRKARKLRAGASAGLALAALGLGACGGGEGGSGGGGAAGGASGSGVSGGEGGSSGEGAGGSEGCAIRTEIDDPSCKACVAERCEAEYADCAGPAWQEGSFEGGKCEAFYACLEGCCGDGACNDACFDGIDPECHGCIHKRTLCTSNACGSVCG